MKISLQLTLDYELFGDGSGDVYREQIIPTNQLMDICDLYDAKLTVYFEYGQYLAYSKYSEINSKLGLDNELIACQLQDLIRRGHDVQFHFHPTWLNAEYDVLKGFLLKKSDFDITSFSLESMISILREGKTFLEELLKPIDDAYTCIAFRAGAWSANDSEKLILALSTSGFKVDSTVAKGAHLTSDYGIFNFKKTPNLPYWFVKDNICSNYGTSFLNILELPILTKKTSLAPFYYLNKKRKSVNFIVKKYYLKKITDQNLSLLGKLKKILKRDFVLGDFNFIPSDKIVEMIYSELKNISSFQNVVPITLIGHSKTSYLNDDLHPLFRRLLSEFDVKFDTVSSFYKNNIVLGDDL